MRRAADVRSMDALKSAKSALAGFREIVTAALSEASSDVQRTLWWIRNDRAAYWRREYRRRNEKLAQAKSELFRATLAASNQRAQCLEEKKLVERAERRLQEAGEKIQLVRKWAMVLDREMLLFRGNCQQLARAVEMDLPRGEAKLELMLEKLEEYLRLAPPTAKKVNPPGETRADAQRDDASPGGAESKR